MANIATVLSLVEHLADPGTRNMNLNMNLNMN